MEKTIIVGQPSKETKTLAFKIGLICFGVFLAVYLFNVVVLHHTYSRIGLLGIILFYAGFNLLSISLDFGILSTIIGVLLYIACAKVAITVTDKRVYGTALWGKRVDLPLDAISAVSTTMLKGIGVATSSGLISFKMIENNEDVHRAISNLLIARQGKQPVAPVVKQEIAKSDADELKKYKDLLDSGVITQEEFDAKKKQILGL